LGKLAKRFIDLTIINVSSNPFHFGFVIPSPGYRRCCMAQTDLVSKQPMRIRAFNSRMIDGSFTHHQRMAIFRRDKVFAKPARTAVGTTGKQITSFLGRTAARLLSRMVRSPVWSRNTSKEGMIQPAA
jgi:hypothetical protein